jgi:hypothetical protein
MSHMLDVYMIEVDDAAVGIVAREVATDLYLFHAAVPGLFVLEGQHFRSPDEARRAARETLGVKPRSRLQDLDCAA